MMTVACKGAAGVRQKSHNLTYNLNLCSVVAFLVKSHFILIWHSHAFLRVYKINDRSGGLLNYLYREGGVKHHFELCTLWTAPDGRYYV